MGGSRSVPHVNRSPEDGPDVWTGSGPSFGTRGVVGRLFLSARRHSRPKPLLGVVGYPGRNLPCLDPERWVGSQSDWNRTPSMDVPPLRTENRER